MTPSRTPAASAACRRLAGATSLLLALLLLLLAAAPAAALIEYNKADRQKIAVLPGPYQEWLEVVELLITRDELDAFLALEQDYQRDAFIKSFWRVRDRYKDTARNETQERIEERVLEIKQSFGSLKEDRARVLLLNGFPTAQFEGRCTGVLKPLEVWYYNGSDMVSFQFFVIFVREGSTYRIWRPFDGIRALRDELMGGGFDEFENTSTFLRQVTQSCRDGEKLAAAIAYVLSEGVLSYEQILGRIQETPELAQGEWVATFNAYTTDVPDDAPRLPAELALDFPGRRQNRTAVQGTVAVPREAAGTAQLADFQSYNFILIGEVLSEGELFDNFRYKFDLPVAEVGAAETLPLVFQRFLRPGDYTLMVKVEDLNSGAFFRSEQPLAVPSVEAGLPPPPQNEATRRLLAEANAALARGETTLQLIEPQGELQTGYVRFDTLTTGDDIARVTFALDGDELLSKARPPWSVDLDLGAVPQPRTLSAVAYDAGGKEVASDELLLNAAGHRFRVDLVEPRKGRSYEHSLSAEARVQVPEGGSVDRVEFFLNETRVATLFQEPWVQPIVLPETSPVAYVRAVAYLPDGNSTEDLVFVNAPDYLEEIDVQFVELYTSVVDRQGRPIEGDFGKGDFRVLEDGVEQQVVRFERVRDLPIHAGILIDVSASMIDDLGQAQQAALGFFEQAIAPRDRASVVTFNDHPNLAVKFTNDVTELAGGLAGLKAERGTALYDSLIFSLYYFNGIKGQRALLVLSDGKDESSRFTFEQALEYARRAGVTLYSVALRDDAAHKKLSKLTEATGGRSYLLQDPAELPAIYDTIQRELRSKYLIAYQSNNATDAKGFRTVEVKLARPGVEVQTMKGYYP